jgi:metal-dependent hydrolase (beta-lactamase superfamily II)
LKPRLGIDPKAIEAVILSLNHSDHTGGLNGFLEQNADVTVHVPQSFPASIRRAVERHRARVKQVSPSHCNGDRVIAMFRDAWGDSFLEGGCGAIIEVLP